MVFKCSKCGKEEFYELPMYDFTAIVGEILRQNKGFERKHESCMADDAEE